MKIIKTNIKDVSIIEIDKIFEDERGYFSETYDKEILKSLGIEHNFVRDNQSGSKKGVLRGLHYQMVHPQGKLVRVLYGEIFDVFVDLRKSSPSFGEWGSVILSKENKRQIMIPEGFAHGFYTMSSYAEILYKMTDYYYSRYDRTLLWNDECLNISWPTKDVIISEKDADGKRLFQADVYE